MHDRRGEALLRIIDTGSFSEAAKRMFVTQPTVTHQIKSLESSLGVRLLERSSNGVRPTAAGEIAAGYYRRIEELERAMERELSNYAAEREEFVISCGDNMVAYDYPAFERVVRCASDLMGSRIKVVSTPPAKELLDRLERREIDLAFTLLEPIADSASIECVSLLVSRRHIVCSTSHPLAACSKGVTADELNGLTVLLPQEDVQPSSAFAEDVRSHPGIHVTFETVPTTSGMLPLVEMGAKVGFSPFRVGDSSRFACVPYRCKSCYHLGVAWHKGRADLDTLRQLGKRIDDIYREVHTEVDEDGIRTY